MESMHQTAKHQKKERTEKTTTMKANELNYKINSYMVNFRWHIDNGSMHTKPIT